MLTCRSAHKALELQVADPWIRPILTAYFEVRKEDSWDPTCTLTAILGGRSAVIS